jgi:hypothetical protein
MRKTAFLIVVTMLLAAVGPIVDGAPKYKYKLTADVIHDNEIYRLRGLWVGKYDGKKLLSQKTISNAEWKQLFAHANDFVALPKSAYKDPDLGEDGEGQSIVEVRVARLGKKKTITYESADFPGSVDDAPAPLRDIAKQIRAVFGD